MGKGSNISKAKRAREDAAKRAKAKGKGGGGAAGKEKRAAPTGHTCAICRRAFPVTMTRPQLLEHVESKHPKKAFLECFPE